MLHNQVEQSRNISKRMIQSADLTLFSMLFSISTITNFIIFFVVVVFDICINRMYQKKNVNVPTTKIGKLTIQLLKDGVVKFYLFIYLLTINISLLIDSFFSLVIFSLFLLPSSYGLLYNHYATLLFLIGLQVGP